MSVHPLVYLRDHWLRPMVSAVEVAGLLVRLTLWWCTPVTRAVFGMVGVMALRRVLRLRDPTH
jgi:hypothetical protein